MDTEQDAAEQPKKRGRPPGSRKIGVTDEQHQEKGNDTLLSERPERAEKPLLLNEEQLGYTAEEAKLSPFSNFLRHTLRYDRLEIIRVARDLDVAENTVYRWMNGNAEPRAVHLKRLLEVLPEHRNNLSYVINQTFPDALNTASPGIREIHKDLYRRVLELMATTLEDDARHWQITQAIFEHALLQLDADRLGLAVTYASLMPLHKDGIHALRESAMRGNPPWPMNLESKVYLGSTTLAGTSAMLQRIQTWDDLNHEDRLVVDVDEFERSAGACPVMRAGRIAGVLIISSTQPGFFADPIASQSIVEYTQLLSLALREQDFHPCSSLSLRPMPELRWQREEINRTYMNRIIACVRKNNISRQEAERLILQEMEEEFEELGRVLAEQKLASVESTSDKIN